MKPELSGLKHKKFPHTAGKQKGFHLLYLTFKALLGPTGNLKPACTSLLSRARIMERLMVTNLSTMRKISILNDRHFLFFIFETASPLTGLTFLSNSLGFAYLSTFIRVYAKT